MAPDEFRHVRTEELHLTQAQLARVLDFNSNVRVSEIERGVLPIGKRVAMLMEALHDGWRPREWAELTGEHGDEE